MAVLREDHPLVGSDGWVRPFESSPVGTHSGEEIEVYDEGGKRAARER